MQRPAKKSSSRQAFEAVFEEQTRRFSAFDLLGLSAKLPSPVEGSEVSGASTHALEPDRLKEALSTDHSVQEQGSDRLSQELGPDRQVEAHGTDRLGQEQGSDRLSQELGPDRQVEAHGTDRLGQEQGSDRGAQGQTVDPQSLGQTVCSSLGQTQVHKRPSKLGTDRLALDELQSTNATLLAPIQWRVWLALKSAETVGRSISYRQIARETKSTINSVRKALRVIQKEGGIFAKETIRTADEQGFRVILNHNVTFRRGTLNEAKAILKRGLSLGQTPRLVPVLGPDGLCMYVCNNINIRQTDIVQLLRLSPPEWKIREQTLIQIADALPNMTAIEFRLSLTYLIEQAKRAKDPIRNPNAWVKAAFEKNGAPLVTEREIEARFEQYPVRRDAQPSPIVSEKGDEDLELLRRYIACKPPERAEIDQMAEKRAAPLLRVVSEDKRAGVMEEARLEAVREFFWKKQ